LRIRGRFTRLAVITIVGTGSAVAAGARDIAVATLSALCALAGTLYIKSRQHAAMAEREARRMH
jgi:hypothetical protein